MNKDKLTRLKDALNLLRLEGVVHTQNDFAELLGRSKSAVSAALHGNEKYLTEGLVQKAELEAQRVKMPEVVQPDIVIPAATAKMYADMAESIRILSELVAAQQGEKGGSAAVSNG